jgi:hypothetical protein
MVAMAMTT